MSAVVLTPISPRAQTTRLRSRLPRPCCSICTLRPRARGRRARSSSGSRPAAARRSPTRRQPRDGTSSYSPTIHWRRALPSPSTAHLNGRRSILVVVAKLTVRSDKAAGGATVLRLEGEIDAQNAPELERALEGARGSAANTVVVDMKAIAYI